MRLNTFNGKNMQCLANFMKYMKSQYQLLTTNGNIETVSGPQIIEDENGSFLKPEADVPDQKIGIIHFVSLPAAQMSQKYFYIFLHKSDR